MKANQAHHRVATMCRVLGVSASGYYARAREPRSGWRGRGRSNRGKRDEELRGTIRTIHKASGGTYGVPRVHAELHRRGCPVSRKRVARLMREAGLVGVSRMRTDARTRAYVARRTQDGLSKREVMRCLKRYVAREIYRVITATSPT